MMYHLPSNRLLCAACAIATCTVGACGTDALDSAEADPDSVYATRDTSESLEAGITAGPEKLLQGGPGVHVVPHLAARADGTAWLSWYAAAGDGGDYSIRLQRMDTTGAKKLGPNGVKISAVDSPSFVTDYALVAAANGDAVVAYTPVSDGIARVQRVTASGALVWGAKGKALNAAPESALAPRAVRTSDDAFVVAWNFESGNTSGVALQRIDAAGRAMWASPLHINGGTGAASPQLAAGDCGDVFLVWRESAFNVPGDALVQRFDARGHAMWQGNLKLNTTEPLPFPMVPEITSDGHGGLYAAWTTIAGRMFRGWVQHIVKDGTTTWAAGGLPVSDNATMSHMPSAIAAAGTRVVVAWTETDADQFTSGLSLQTFDAAGKPIFAPEGLPLIEPTDALGGSAAAVRTTGGNAAVFYAFAPPNESDVRAGVASVKMAATPSPTFTTLSDVPSAKSHPDVSALIRGGYWLVWEDGRSGSDEIWGTWWPARSLRSL